ncbi:odorant receptor 63a-like isoform X2 [Vespa crabro]|uniref:odorant receptor 63a-like isoform X2 n=1 Tax=Vespa crabro TaxID=7445 RepID=UPI001F00BB92|nr:odorant receptor 63a-like isoform X2 [Vespa crabro]
MMLTENSISGPIEFGLRLIGLWPNYTYAIFHRILWTMTMIFVLFSEYVYVVMHIKTDELPDLMDSLTITLSNSLLFIKLIILWFNDRIFEDILIMIIEDYENNDERNNRERMKKKVILSQRFASCTIILYSTTVILFSISVIFASERVPVLKMELPFDSMKSPIYEIVSILQFIQELLFASTSGLLNGLIVTLMLHLGGQAEIMCQRLGDISLEIINGKSCKDNLRSLIYAHQRIINFSTCVESVFNYIALIQFLSNTLAICFSGFVIITGKAIGEAAYTCTWYELRPNESRYFLLLILRSQKRLTITIGKFMDLSLECFASILKASASYVSVLYAMY